MSKCQWLHLDWLIFPSSFFSGLVFSVSEVEKLLGRIRLASTSSLNEMLIQHSFSLNDNALVYLTAVIEYACAELLEVAVGRAVANGHARIVPNDLLQAVQSDEELCSLFWKEKYSGEQFHGKSTLGVEISFRKYIYKILQSVSPTIDSAIQYVEIDQEQDGEDAGKDNQWDDEDHDRPNKVAKREVVSSVPHRMGISKAAIGIVNEGLHLVIQRLFKQALRSAQVMKRITGPELELSWNYVQAAVRLTFNGELAKHAVFSGDSARLKFEQHSQG